MKRLDRVLGILIVCILSSALQANEIGDSLGQWDLRRWQTWAEEPPRHMSVEFVLGAYVQGYVDAWVRSEAEIATVTDTVVELRIAISACSQRDIFAPTTIVDAVKNTGVLLDQAFIDWFGTYAIGKCDEVRGVYAAQSEVGFTRSVTE